MKPPSFEYARPITLDEALSPLAQAGDEAGVLAGDRVSCRCSTCAWRSRAWSSTSTGSRAWTRSRR